MLNETHSYTHTFSINSSKMSKLQPLMRTQLLSPTAVPYIASPAPVTFTAPTSQRLRRRLLSRPGLLGVKRGMTCYYDNLGVKHPATIIEIVHNEVLQHKVTASSVSLQLGGGYVKPQNVTKQMLGHFAQARVSPKEYVADFPLTLKSELEKYPVGSELLASHFEQGQFVDVIAHTKGKGFQGVMRRWGFGGGNASHGASLSHRSAGSTGMNTTPSRVFPGKKMAGRMGGDERTVFNLKVLDVNGEKGYLLLKGGVPGSKGNVLKIRDALKKNGIHLGVMIEKGKIKQEEL